jgi:hypothetical protein
VDSGDLLELKNDLELLRHKLNWIGDLAIMVCAVGISIGILAIGYWLGHPCVGAAIGIFAGFISIGVLRVGFHRERDEVRFAQSRRLPDSLSIRLK